MSAITYLLRFGPSEYRLLRSAYGPLRAVWQTLWVAIRPQSRPPF